MHHIVHLKRVQTSSDAGGGWGQISGHQETHTHAQNVSIRKASSLSSLTRKAAKHDRYRAVARIVKAADRSTTHTSNRLPWVARTQVPDQIWSHWLRGGERPTTPSTRRDATRPTQSANSRYRERAASVITIGALWVCRVASAERQMLPNMFFF